MSTDLFDRATWLNPPARVVRDGSEIVVAAKEGSDFWRTTYYDFVHDDGHALLHPFPLDSAIEVDLLIDFEGQFDQAGILIRQDDATWVKCGVEIVDGVAGLGAVVTHQRSDWSSSPAADVRGKMLTMRVSRSRDALTIRARPAGLDWRFIRLAPIDPSAIVSAGPYVCAPTRGGLSVRFARFEALAADGELHG